MKRPSPDELAIGLTLLFIVLVVIYAIIKSPQST